MVEQHGKAGKLLGAAAVGAVVELAGVSRGLEVLAEAVRLVELAVTEETLVEIAVPRVVVVPADRGGDGRVVVVPAQLLLRDEAVGVVRADHLVERLAIDVGSAWARACFEMVGDTTGCREAALAKWTADVGAAVDARLEMLLIMSSGVLPLEQTRTWSRLLPFMKLRSQSMQ